VITAVEPPWRVAISISAAAMSRALGVTLSLGEVLHHPDGSVTGFRRGDGWPESAPRSLWRLVEEAPDLVIGTEEDDDREEATAGRAQPSAGRCSTCSPLERSSGRPPRSTAT
jgi:hypothetical protein